MDIFSALADPTRRQILEMLAQNGPMTAGDICENFITTAPAISQHLRALRQTNLVQVEKRGQQRIYRINSGALLELEGWATRLQQMWERRFDALERILEAEKQQSIASLEQKEN